MEKIEVGEYVRTKDGIIDKVIIDYDGKCNNSNCNEKHISCKYNYYNEEDIARIAKLITTKFNNDYSIDNKDKEAIEHILSDYKRVLKEAERYKNMYKAEHEIHLVRNEQLDRKENAITRCKELENENKTIKEANNYWKSRYCEISNNSIPIQKVKNKIEEIGEKIKYEENEKVVIYLHKQKNILQELLESEE